MLTDEQLQEIDERCESASDGPWISQCNRWDNGTYSGTTTYVVLEGEGPICEVWDRDMYPVDVQGNANFISHARTDIPDLLAHIREIEAEKAHRERALYFQSSRMVKHFRGNMLCCIDKQCADDGGCIECLTAQALVATKEAPCPK